MSKLRNGLFTHLALGSGLIASAFLFTGNWVAVLAVGSLLGFVLPYALKTEAAFDAGPVGSLSSDRLLRLTGSGLVAVGVGVLLYLFIGGYLSTLYSLRPGLGSATAFLPAFLTGLGLNMALTAFRFMYPNRDGA